MEEQASTSEAFDSTGLDSQADAAMGPIRACVSEALAKYFDQLNGHDCEGLYRLVLTEVEVPLLEAVMRYCGGNQTKASQVLGINRGTLRKKLQQYGLDS